MGNNMKTYSLLAGFFCMALAAFTQGLLPMLEPQSTTRKVTKVVRTDLGQLKWMASESTDYTPSQAAGREIYIREGCWYCHSQYIRPVTGETRRWGPVTQSGEYAFDTPHLFSTRRIGPDLSRVGLKYSDEWHLAHFWDPRMVVPDSIMPNFSKLFDAPEVTVKIVTDDAGNRTLERTPATEKIFDYTKAGDAKAQMKVTPSKDGLLFIRHRGRYPIIWTPGKEFEGDTVKLAVMTDELEDLIAYLQKLGTNRGKWRDLFEPQRINFLNSSAPASDEWIAYGKKVYEQRCAGCHGVDGDGNGPASTFLYETRARDFTKAVFKFKQTPSGSLPTDGDLMRTITRGVRGTSMPSWHMLTEKARLAVIQYIKHELAVDRSDKDDPFAVFLEEEPEAPLHIGRPPEPSAEMIVEGKDIWLDAKCWECHGKSGAGDGEKAAGLKGDDKFPIPPADLTAGQFKSGADAADIYRTISTGLSGTPMPSFSDSLDEDQRWALSYYILSLSAFTDPLTRKALNVPDAVRQALNDPELDAPSSAKAYSPEATTADGRNLFGGDAWAQKHGIEVGDAAADDTKSKTQ